MSKLVEANEAGTSIQLAKNKIKRAIILSVVTFIGGVVLGVAGVAIDKIPVLVIGSVVALVSFGWLLAVKNKIRRFQKKRQAI